MSEAERRKNYRFDRVLIETADTLESDFPNAIVHLTGGQLNILRNLMDYATRIESFVSSYQDTYYLVPTDADWETLSSIVADLENVLMGNNNTIWGYNDRLYEPLGDTLTGDGTYQALTGPVPEGKVWKIELVNIRNITGVRGSTFCYAQIDSTNVQLAATATPSITVPLAYNGLLTLKEGDRAGVAMNSCLNGDVIQAFVVGYVMQVPA